MTRPEKADLFNRTTGMLMRLWSISQDATDKLCIRQTIDALRRLEDDLLETPA